MNTATTELRPGGVVDSLLHPLAQEVRGLLRHPQRDAADRSILIDDEENILQALRAGVRLERLFHAGEETPSEGLLRALPPGVGVYEVARRTCKKLFDNDKVSRLFAVARAPAPVRLEDLDSLGGDVVVLDGLGIAGNVGAIVRTAAALGAGAVVLLNSEAADVYDRRLIRASRGNVFSLPVVKAHTGPFLAFCRARGLPLLVATPRGEAPVGRLAALPRPLALAFGNELEGCSPALEAAARFRVRIPTDPRVESLNVSAAAAIALFHRMPGAGSVEL
ncbi:23S rRNA (adenosine(1067)-2'-O)-methyltransferase [Calidithermus terrae]|uniref:23S rRNA (Adenosine(1067)-2'-O)-methyltransferase n=1 Tax=Calidithermus terrae TaxID=1408545 RepID=A0A399EVP7_9DEIN|nr:TrmH family RNA methyltransferase [Calidithermus terrae]RIH87743.1 23S rRNA (adenosine(1067)-2'-O)-methyltransferase [Calidithermus terrae]